MPATSRRSSNFDNNNEINNNVGCMQPFNANCVVSTTSGNAAASSVTAMPPMVAVAKAALCNEKNTESATPNAAATTIATPETTTVTSKHAKVAGVSTTAAASATEQRRQSQIANIKLISLVRRRPWLYDSSHCNYAKKHLIEKTWTQIGRICNESGAICKERWRNIRAAFARSINIYKTQSGPNRLKPYYLHRELQFLINPMTKGRKSLLKTDDSSAEEASCEEQEDHDMDGHGRLLMNEDEEEDDDAGLGSGEENSATSKSNKITPAKNTVAADKNGLGEEVTAAGDSNNSRVTGTEMSADAIMEDSTNFSFSDDAPERTRMPDCDDVSQQLTRLKKDRFEDIPDDADLLFVKSLYYDMCGLDASQKRRLKRYIYEALEQVSASPTVAASLIPPPVMLTAAQKQSLSLMRNLDETKLQNLNRFIQYVLAPATNETASRMPGHVVASTTHRPMQNVPMTSTGILPRTPQTSRMPATSEATNGGLSYAFTVKEESLEDLV